MIDGVKGGVMNNQYTLSQNICGEQLVIATTLYSFVPGGDCLPYSLYRPVSWYYLQPPYIAHPYLALGPRLSPQKQLEEKGPVVWGQTLGLTLSQPIPPFHAWLSQWCLGWGLTWLSHALCPEVSPVILLPSNGERNLPSLPPAQRDTDNWQRYRQLTEEIQSTDRQRYRQLTEEEEKQTEERQSTERQRYRQTDNW